MRAALRFTLTGGSTNASVRVDEVRSPMYRDYWFRFTWNGATGTVDCYDTRREAEAGAPKLASGTLTGSGTVSLTVAPGARFDPTPMQVTMRLDGTFTDALVGHVAAVESALVDRVALILARYTALNESLAGVKTIVKFDAAPEFMPYVGVTAAGMVTGSLGGAGGQSGDFDLDLYAATVVMDNDLAAQAILELAGTLRSIALDEQRTWGGWAQDTVARGAMQPLVDKKDGGGFLFTCLVPITVKLWDIQPAIDPNGSALAGVGGKYITGL